jgi:proteasome alpha subunit
MCGTTEPIIAALNDTYAENASLREAVKIAVDALRVGIARQWIGARYRTSAEAD